MGLYVSAYYVLESVPAEKQGLWAKAWAIAVQRYVKSRIGEISSAVEIKWPNDVLIDGRKVGGMLIENSVRGMWLSDCIVGIGVNLNQSDFSDFETPAVSIGMITGRNYDVAKEAVELAAYLDWSLAAIHSDARHTIDSAYHACLFGLNKSLNFVHADERVNAIMKGVDDNGLAILESSNGRILVSHPDYRLSLVPDSNT
jgi:BirA family biotin operon repressor/biotin-[acetyl-CoA-carboxylase] ligase